MKNAILLFSLCLFTSCVAKLNYLGDTYEVNPNPVDVFYDIGDIERDYKVIGKLSGHNQGLVTIDEIRVDMIESARKKGADGIIFMHFDSFDENHNIYADLIRYK